MHISSPPSAAIAAAAASAAAAAAAALASGSPHGVLPTAEIENPADQALDAVYQSNETRIGPYLHRMITNTASKIRDIKRTHPERPIILVIQYICPRNVVVRLIS